MRPGSLRSIVLFAFVVATFSAAFAADQAPGEPQPVPFGEKFPAWSFANLNEGVGGPAKIDIASVLGKKPVVFYYWIAGNTRSEQTLLDLQALVNSLGPQKIVLLAVATPGAVSTDTLPIRQRVQALKVQVPVLNDDGFRLGRQLAVRSVPSINIVDTKGVLRLGGGGSLLQTIEYNMTVETAVRRVAQTGQLGTYGALPTYYPVTELIGKKSPDFDAICLNDGVSRRWSSLLSRDKVNVLVFWSVDCPHCRESLPKVNTFLKGHAAEVNLIGAAKIVGEQMRTKTQDYIRLSGLDFTNLADQDLKIGDLFNVVSTPTFVIIRPDGVVDSVVLSGDADFGREFEEKIKEILKPSRS